MNCNKPMEKETVTIERWLIYDSLAKSYSVCAESNIDGYINDDRTYLSKIRLISKEDVEL